MAIRKHPTKGPGWWIIILSQGRKKKQITYTYEGSEAEALAFEADLRGIPSEAKDQRLQDVLGRFLDWYYINRAARTVSEAEAMLPKIIGRLGNRHLALLRQNDFDRYKAGRLDDGVKKRTINVELSYLRSLMKYADNELKIPIGDLPKLYTKRQTNLPTITPYTPDEITRLLEQLNGDKRSIVMLYSYCGLRRTEALRLKCNQVDLSSGLLYVTGKGDKNRVVPIVGDALKQRLKMHCQGKKPTDWLFINPDSIKNGGEPKPYLDIKKSIQNAARRASITKPIWAHLMRHSGATAAIQAGVGLRELQDLLGHSDIRMTEHYTHLSAIMAKSAGEKMAAIHPAPTSEISETKTTKNSKVIQLHSRKKK